MPRAKTSTKKAAAKPVKAAEPAASGSVHPLPPGYRDPRERSLAIDAAAMVEAALNRCRPGTKSGNANKCWKALSHTDRVRIAEAHCVRHLSAERIRAEVPAVAAGGITASSLDRFLRDVRASYTKVYEERISELTEVDHAAFATGDLVALAGIVYARLAPRFVAAGMNIGPGSSPKEMHPILRFMEGMSDAAKVQADAKQKELQSVLLAIRAEAADGRRARSQRDRGESQQRIVELVDRHLRGEVA